LWGTVSSSPNAVEEYKQGHSHIGSAWDAGPRQKPWAIDGIARDFIREAVKNNDKPWSASGFLPNPHPQLGLPQA